MKWGQDIIIHANTKETQYELLCYAAKNCGDCPNVYHKLTYLNSKNGDINSPIMFIGEAPGFVRVPEERLQAFGGNQSGWNFEYLLMQIGLDRSKVFVTNALLHSPVKPSTKKYDDDYGYLTIRPPSQEEIKECGKFLRAQLAIVNPRIICTLGRAALNACSLVLPNFPAINLSVDVGKWMLWENRVILPFYHTSPNVTASIRPLSKMVEDFKNLKQIMDLNGIKL